MRLSKKLIQIFTIITFLSLTSINSYATDKGVSIEPIFTYEDGLWYPGRVENKDFYIKNNEENRIKVDRLYIRLESSKDLKINQVLNIDSTKLKELTQNSTIKLTYKDHVLLEDRLDNIINQEEIVLSKEIDIKPNEKVLLNMTIDMSEGMNNYAQAIESILSIGVAYKVEAGINIGDTSDDGDKKPSGDEGNSSTDIGKLPQTGGLINSESLLLLGTIIVTTGVVLNKKSLGNKGGKHNE
ncbi:MAG: hypothetical protein ACRDDM_07800 [Paraclostridium sp.]